LCKKSKRDLKDEKMKIKKKKKKRRRHKKIQRGNELDF